MARKRDDKGIAHKASEKAFSSETVMFLLDPIPQWASTDKPRRSFLLHTKGQSRIMCQMLSISRGKVTAGLQHMVW